MNERMSLLLKSGVISQSAHDGVLAVIELLNREWLLDPSNEQYQMAITHLARATDRIKKGEPVAEGLDQDSMNEIINDESYSTVIHMNENVCKIVGLADVPETENSFFICNLFSLNLTR